MISTLLLAGVLTAHAAPADERQTKVIMGGVQIVRAARNPKSVDFAGVWANPDASVICYELRAQNGFGGLNLEHVAYIKGRATRDGATWNARCRGKDVTEVRDAARAIKDVAAMTR